MAKSAFEKWFRKQPESSQEIVEEHIEGLRSALLKERKGRANAERALREGHQRSLDEAEFSHENLRDLLDKALKARSPDLKFWIRDVYDEFFVYQNFDSERKFQVDYEIDDNGNATLGEPTEVVASTQYTPVAPSSTEESENSIELESQFVPLTEKAVSEDGKVPVKLIAPGWGSSGYYSPEVLERDVPEIFPKGTKMYWDHPTLSEEAERPERTLRDLAAVLVSDPYYDEVGKDGPGMYAEAEVFEGFRQATNELAPHIGLSIRAMGVVEQGEAEGRQGPIVSEMAVGKSVDFVTEPGAGGKVLELFEAARQGDGRRSERQTRPIPAKGKTKSKENSMEENKQIEELKESNEELLEENARLKEAQLTRDAREVANERLAEVDSMPVPTRKRIGEQVSKNPPTTKDGNLDKEAFVKAIDEAVKAEAAYLSEVSGAGTIRGMGGEGEEEDEASAKEAEASIQESLQRMDVPENVAKRAAMGR